MYIQEFYRHSWYIFLAFDQGNRSEDAWTQETPRPIQAPLSRWTTGASEGERDSLPEAGSRETHGEP